MRYFPSAAPRSSTLLLLAGFLLLGLGSVFIGLLIALGGVYVAALVTAVVLFVAGLVLPTRLLFYLIVLIIYVAVGQLQYFARIDKAFWIPYLLGLFLYLRLLAQQINQPRSQASPKQARSGAAALAACGLFIVTAAVSSLFSGVEPLQWLVAGKEYFFLWSVLLAFLLRAVEPDDFDRLLGLVPWFLALQIPAVLYQRFVIVPGRSGDSVFDAVVGLFGGDPQSGGASGAMAVFSLVVTGFMLQGWRAGRLSTLRALGTVVLALAPLLLAEVKILLVLLPVVLMLVFGADLLRRPLQALAALLAGALLMVATLWAYQTQFTSDKTAQGKSLAGYVEVMIERNSDVTQISRYGEMGRIAALNLWWREQHVGDPTGFLIGHGLGATRVGGLVVGELAQKFRFRPGRSTLAVYLWETGVLGTFALIAGLLAVVRLGWRTARRPDRREKAWLLRGAAGGLLLIVLAFPYNTDFVEVSQIQVLALLLMGYIIARARQPAASAGAPGEATVLAAK